MDRIAEAVVAFVSNAAWQSAVIALIGIGAARLLHGAPERLRFLLVALTLVAAVTAPVMTLGPHSQARTTHTVSISNETGSAAATLPEPLPFVRASLNRCSAEIVTILYVAGLLLATARLLVAARRTRRLLARSQAFAEGI